MDLSVVAPVYNEEGNLEDLYGELKEVLEGEDLDYEIIFVDDGSEDDSFEIMKGIGSEDPRFKAVKLRRNFGQSSALQAGFDISRGGVIVSIDSDLQNDPADVPKLLEKLDEGYDCVVGWRKEREDPAGKKFFSWLASRIRRFFLGTNLHDYGCTLKALTDEAAESLKITGEMHRYVPPLLRWRGFDVAEVEVNHRERRRGETSYGPSRLVKGFMDMVNVWFWQKFHGRPLHLFGGMGILSASIGFVGGLIAVYWKVFRGMAFTSTPLPLFATFMVLMGVLLFVSGLLADVMLKNYHSVHDRKTYSVEEVVE